MDRVHNETWVTCGNKEFQHKFIHLAKSPDRLCLTPYPVSTCIWKMHPLYTAKHNPEPVNNVAKGELVFQCSRGQPHPKYKTNFKGPTTAKRHTEGSEQLRNVLHGTHKVKLTGRVPEGASKHNMSSIRGKIGSPGRFVWLYRPSPLGDYKYAYHFHCSLLPMEETLSTNRGS